MSWIGNNKKEILVSFVLTMVLLSVLFTQSVSLSEEISSRYVMVDGGGFLDPVVRFLDFLAFPATALIDSLYNTLPSGAVFALWPFIVSIPYTALGTAYLLLPIVLIKRLFPALPRWIRYVPAVLAVCFLVGYLLLMPVPKESRGPGFIKEDTAGIVIDVDPPVYRGEGEDGDFRGFLDTIFLLDGHHPRGDDRVSPQNAAAAYTNYCTTIPQRRMMNSGSPAIPTISSTQYCLYLVNKELRTNISELDEFVKQFPRWQGRLGISKSYNPTQNLDPAILDVEGILQEKSDFEYDLTTYVCKKVYGWGAMLDNDEQYQMCMKIGTTYDW